MDEGCRARVGAVAWVWVLGWVVVWARRRGVLVRSLVCGQRRGFSRIWPCKVGDVRRRVPQ